jgi:hypothetical protein
MKSSHSCGYGDLLLYLEDQAAGSSEMLVMTCQTTRPRIPKTVI